MKVRKPTKREARVTLIWFGLLTLTFAANVNLRTGSWPLTIATPPVLMTLYVLIRRWIYCHAEEPPPPPPPRPYPNWPSDY